MIRTHIRIAHIASIRTGSPVDSRQCDWGINAGPTSQTVANHLASIRSTSGKVL